MPVQKVGAVMMKVDTLSSLLWKWSTNGPRPGVTMVVMALVMLDPKAMTKR